MPLKRSHRFQFQLNYFRKTLLVFFVFFRDFCQLICELVFQLILNNGSLGKEQLHFFCVSLSLITTMLISTTLIQMRLYKDEIVHVIYSLYIITAWFALTGCRIALSLIDICHKETVIAQNVSYFANHFVIYIYCLIRFNIAYYCLLQFLLHISIRIVYYIFV